MNREIDDTKLDNQLAPPTRRPKIDLVLDVEILEDRIAPSRLGFFLQNQPFTPHVEECCT